VSWPGLDHRLRVRARIDGRVELWPTFGGKGVALMFFLIRRIVRYFQSRKQEAS
jgi:hypothetical protein